jgi:sodium/hydrogen antiporter
VLERTGLPSVAAFLALGALLGPIGLGLVDIGFESPSLRVLAMLGLALVLFSDAVTIEISEIRARPRLLAMLLGPGTVVPAILISFAAWLLLEVHPAAAAIIGAALASTDPVLLRSVLRSPALPAIPRVALRFEAGTNDVVLLPIVVIAMLFLGPEAANGSPPVARHLVGLFLLGPALGGIVGLIGITLLARVRAGVGVRRDYEALYALGLAFTGFAAAEAAGGSGFLAAFAAGLVVASQDVELCDCFLEYGEASAEMLLLLTFVALGTSLIWTGLGVIDWRTLVFALFALAVRTIVLYPVLARAGLSARDLRLIALFGPRGLSSLLLTLLPVFAGLPGSQRLFSVTCLVVLLSVIVHGGVTAVFLRVHDPRRHGAPPVPLPAVGVEDVPERISLDEMRELEARGDPVIIVDARAQRSYNADDRAAAGAVRVAPEDPVRDATAQRLAQHATLVVYCA